MFYRATSLLLLTMLIGCLTPAPGALDTVLDADQERIDAMVDADRAMLEHTLHADLTYTHSTGALDTRSSLIESLTSGISDYRAIAPLGPSVRIRGDTALLTTRTRMEVTVKGDLLALDIAYTAVYTWESGRWQLIAYHSSPLKP